LDEETLQFYGRNAQAYAKREITKHTRLARFLALLPPGAAILELGCGAGADSAEMLARGFDVRPTDGSPEMASVASRRLGRPVETLLFQDLNEVEAYDGVWANACLLHVPRPELVKVLALTWCALKPGGFFYASFKTGADEGRDALTVTITIRLQIGCEPPTMKRAVGVHYRWTQARSEVSTTRWPRCCLSSRAKPSDPQTVKAP
jgi:SAM-dependent methyltransferase